jgi:AraC-like DNA-binding protein
VPAVASPDRVVFATPEVCVGEFRCPTDHPAFRNSGPSSHYCFAFPRTAVVIRHGDARIFADATVATLYNRAQEYEREAISPKGDICEWFGVSPRLLRDVLAARDQRAADDEQRPIRFTHAPVAASLYLKQRAVYRAASGGSADLLWAEEAVLDLTDRVLAAAYGAAVASAGSGRTRDLVHDTTCLLARDPAAPLGLAAIADALGASMFHVSRCFRACTGRTLHEYRTELRLRASLDGLESAHRDLSRVALDSGFSSHSHFTAAFRRRFGVTPSAARAGLVTPLETTKTRPE